MGYVIEEVNGINVCVYGQTCEFGILYSEKQGARCVTEDESIAGCYVHSYSL
ncbi:MAG: hypothetical protein DHS20C13_29640 [Thermodesulfobacteriota bacterium]|nr:MAG: hypothetical protein DHS20C13_29640 [Thermodesulfobacteriota bacterium]